MASVNKVILVGRLTREVETHTFQNGGKVAKLGLAVTGQRKKDPATGKWEEEPCFVDVKASDRENGRKLADVCQKYLGKGHLCGVEGRLVTESWTDKSTGQQRSKLVIHADDIILLQPKGTAPGTQPAAPPQRQAAPANNYGDQYEGPGDEAIPF